MNDNISTEELITLLDNRLDNKLSRLIQDRLRSQSRALEVVGLWMKQMKFSLENIKEVQTGTTNDNFVLYEANTGLQCYEGALREINYLKGKENEESN